MSRFLLLATLSFLCCATPAAAQTNPEFAAAMEAQDFTQAERIIAASFDRAQAADAEGPQTGLLAVTLASLRLVQGKYEEALAPAQLGLRILEARGAEARGAHFLVARAELGADGDAEDAARLRDLIAGNRTRPELVVHIHHGSVELATWAMREHRFGEARDAWRIAGETANNSFFGAHYGRGVSRIGEAAAMLYAEADRPPYRIDAETNATIQTMFEEGLRVALAHRRQRSSRRRDFT